jgi:hypothetical protein
MALNLVDQGVSSRKVGANPRGCPPGQAHLQVPDGEGLPLPQDIERTHQDYFDGALDGTDYTLFYDVLQAQLHDFRFCNKISHSCQRLLERALTPARFCKGTCLF